MSVKMHRRLFGVDAKKVGGDAGYACNANRELCGKKRIQTTFEKRGRLALMKRRMISSARERATRMEGSFGTQKEHYGLKWIKTRTRLTEILYISASTRRTWSNLSGGKPPKLFRQTDVPHEELNFMSVLAPVVA